MNFKIVTGDTILVAYINDLVALTTHIYDQLSGQLGLFVNDGEATFEKVTLSTP